MRIFWFEFLLALRRLGRRRTQNGLMLVTFAVSVTLSLLSWSLFHTVHLSQPDFDPKGEYYVLGHAGEVAVSSKQFTVDEIAAYKASSELFDDFAEVAFYLSTFVKTPHGEERVLGSYLSARALQLVGARPLIGALFEPADDVYRAPGKVLLSEKMWTNSYGRDPDILGKVIEVSGYPSTIVGVMPASFRFPNEQDMWMSLGSCYDHPNYPLRAALVKLKPGITKARAERDLQAILSNLPTDTPARKRGQIPALVSYRDFYLLADLRVSALILFALSLLFVAVSCANAANLMVIDFLGRRPEVAASLALGIPKGAAIRSVCWQVGVIALAAATVAVALLPVAGPLLFDRIKIINAPYWLVYHFAWRDVGMALLLTGISAGVTVIAPIMYLLLVDPDKVIRDHAYASRGTGRALWRRLLLTGQIALLTMLGVCAGLLVRSNRNVGASHWGYNAGRIFEGKISALSMEYPKGRKNQFRLEVHRRVLAEVRRRPETVAAAFADNPPGYSNGPYCTYATNPAALDSGQGTGEAFYSRVTERYFDTFDVPFVAGADFPEEVPDNGLPYAIINESLARKLWPDGDALQRTLFVNYPWMKEGAPPMQLVIWGVVRDFQANGPRARSNDAIFTPYLKEAGAGSAVTMYLRDRADLPTFKSINDAVHRAEPREALYFPSTTKRQIELMLSSVRMTTDLTSVFAAAAVLLCAIGVYSLTVTQVLQSSREFGIRMALGAEPLRLWRHFTRGHLVTALIGVAVGLVGAGQLVRVLRSLLYGVDPYSPATYAGVAGAILLVAVLACVPSLFRLRRINPADCLRSL